MTKRAKKSKFDGESANLAAVASMRRQFVENIASINTLVSQFVDLSSGRAAYKAAIRDRLNFLLICATYSISSIDDHERDILVVLSYLKQEARVASDAAQAKAYSIKRYTPKNIAADGILDSVDNLRNTLALLLYLYRNLEKPTPPVPDVPNQIPAPIRVEVNDDRLKLTILQTHSRTISVASLDKIRSAIQELLDRTIKQVGSSSNADPRLAPNLTGLDSYLCIDITAMPIEALGLNY